MVVLLIASSVDGLALPSGSVPDPSCDAAEGCTSLLCPFVTVVILVGDGDF